MRNRSFLPLLGLLPFLTLVLLSPPADAGTVCPPAPVQALALPHLKAALKAGEPVVIAALGSSSTWGAKASDISDSYPAELQDDLADLLPDAEISVINRGVSGQDAKGEDARMGRDVLALRPSLVIWQVGANAAMWHEPAGKFSTLVETGLDRLSDADTDIVLMDNQRSRILLASPENAPINDALARLARRYHASLFSRNALMRAWQDAGVPEKDFLAADGLHMNDRGYACTARALAQSIVEAVR